VDPDRPVADLSMGERQRVEIVKLLVQEARALIFDEPTAVLAQPEVEGFFAVLRRLTADGRAVLFITHKLEEVLAAADRIAILRRGRVMARLLPAEVGSRRDLRPAHGGPGVRFAGGQAPPHPGAPCGRGEPLRAGFADVTLTVRQGEIVSVVGRGRQRPDRAGRHPAGLARAVPAASSSRAKPTPRPAGRPPRTRPWPTCPRTATAPGACGTWTWPRTWP
jgi:simple sugar transport system ATP-binding protein